MPSPHGGRRPPQQSVHGLHELQERGGGQHLVLACAGAKADGRADRQLPRNIWPDPDAVYVGPVGCALPSGAVRQGIYPKTLFSGQATTGLAATASTPSIVRGHAGKHSIGLRTAPICQGIRKAMRTMQRHARTPARFCLPRVVGRGPVRQRAPAPRSVRNRWPARSVVSWACCREMDRCSSTTSHVGALPITTCPRHHNRLICAVGGMRKVQTRRSQHQLHNFDCNSYVRYHSLPQ